MNRVEAALSRATETKALLIDKNIVDRSADFFTGIFPDKKAVIIADRNTYAVAGQQVHDALAKAGIPQLEPFIFTDKGLYAKWQFVEQLDAFLSANDAIPIAVGSGTINDLTKLSSFHNNRRYMCVATAASMDGYTAYGASIDFKGSKQTFDCPAPLGVLADTAIIARAPSSMSASGYADLFAKVTAGADWILAESMEIEPIDNFAFSLVQDGLKNALNNPAGVKNGDINAIEPLVEGLILSGFAMQAAQSSRPASGADHQFSHLWDMEHHKHNGVSPSHGFKVSIGMLASTILYDELLSTPIEQLNIEACVEAWADISQSDKVATEMFKGTDFPTIGLTETHAKYVSKELLRQELTILKKNWPEIRQRLQHQIIPLSEVKRRLDLVGAPTSPEQIGISRERLRQSFIRAQLIRRRYTILDLAVRSCNMERWLDNIFSHGGVWEVV